jgi:hypothetical protein
VTQGVDPDAVLDAARVYNSVRTSASCAVTRLAGALANSAGMAGTDLCAHEWATKYDPLAWAAMDAASAVVQGAGQCYDLLYATGVNHLNADGQSAINNEQVLELPPMGAPPFAKPTVRQQKADTATFPSGGTPSRLTSRASSGRMVIRTNCELRPTHGQPQAVSCGPRRSLSTAGQVRWGVLAPLMDQKSPEFPNVIKNCTMVRDQMSGVTDGFDEAVRACSTYAQAIDDAHSKIIHEMVVVGATVAVTEIVAAILVPLTAGISEAVSKVVDVSRLTATGARIATLIREFRLAAELSGLPAVSAAGAAARSMSELGPLLAARPTTLPQRRRGVVARLKELRRSGFQKRASSEKWRGIC